MLHHRPLLPGTALLLFLSGACASTSGDSAPTRLEPVDDDDDDTGSSRPVFYRDVQLSGMLDVSAAAEAGAPATVEGTFTVMYWVDFELEDWGCEQNYGWRGTVIPAAEATPLLCADCTAHLSIDPDSFETLGGACPEIRLEEFSHLNFGEALNTPEWGLLELPILDVPTAAALGYELVAGQDNSEHLDRLTADSADVTHLVFVSVEGTAFGPGGFDLTPNPPGDEPGLAPFGMLGRNPELNPTPAPEIAGLYFLQPLYWFWQDLDEQPIAYWRYR